MAAIAMLVQTVGVPRGRIPATRLAVRIQQWMILEQAFQAKLPVVTAPPVTPDTAEVIEIARLMADNVSVMHPRRNRER